MSYNEKALKDELALPAYDGKSDQEATNIMNAEIMVNSSSVLGSDIAAAIDETEYKALSDTKKLLVLNMVQAKSFNPNGFGQIAIKDIFPNGGATIMALAPYKLRETTRAKEIGLRLCRVGWVTLARAQ